MTHQPPQRDDPADIDRHLRRLAAAYPAFTFGHEIVNPWKGPRWVAERRDRNAPGTRVVITGDLMELHKALQPYKVVAHAAR
jgi:hypothetical protein